jgi:hypothetical protein
MIIFLVPVGTRLMCTGPAFHRWLFDSERFERVILSQASCRGFVRNYTIDKTVCTPLEGTVIYIHGDTSPNLSLAWNDMTMDLGIYKLPFDDSPPI